MGSVKHQKVKKYASQQPRLEGNNSIQALVSFWCRRPIHWRFSLLMSVRVRAVAVDYWQEYRITFSVIFLC